MGRGLGPGQRAILAALAEHTDGLMVADLIGPDSYDYVAASSCRRSLARMKQAGLVTDPRQYRHAQGKPVAWQITDAGREALTRLREEGQG